MDDYITLEEFDKLSEEEKTAEIIKLFNSIPDQHKESTYHDILNALKEHGKNNTPGH